MEDSTAMTIDFLRARLLAERSVSRTARQRADELAQRVMELEEQLKIVSLQRKKAEKATADVLAILGNHGRTDVSETFDSSSDHETEVVTSSVKGEEPETFSGSEHESSTQLGRSLSWKSSSDRHSLEKKYLDSSRRRRSGFASSGSSSPKHVGKSCRQIRRREHRSAVEQSQNDSRSPCEDEVVTNSEGLNTCSNIGHEISKEGSENGNERDLTDAPVSVVLGSRSVSNGHYLNNHRGGDRDMERALQNQAQLIGRFEAEEKAQREWEEKFKENNDSTADSCDPGNQSDITEERDEMKSAAPSFSNGIITSQNPKDEFGERDASNDKDHNAPSPHPSDGKVDEHNLKNHQHPHTSKHSPNLRDMPVNNSPQISSSEIHNSYKGEAPEIANDFALIPQEKYDELGSVLEALQQAKLSLRQNLNRLPVQEDRIILREKEPSFPSAGYRDRYAMPVISTGLFRLPTDYQYEVTDRVNSLGYGVTDRVNSLGYGVTDRVNSLGSASKLTTGNYFPDPFSSSPYRESKSSSSNDDRFLTVPTFPYPELRPRVPTRSPIFDSGVDAALPSFRNNTNLDPHPNAGIPSPSAGVPSYGKSTNLHPHSNAGLPSSSRFSHSTQPSYPDMIPRMPSDRVSGFHSNGDAGSSPSHFSFYDDRTRPNTYR